MSMREQVLKHIIKKVASSTPEQDEMKTAAICLFWSAHEEIYERLRAASKRNWRLPTVIEGAPSASSWFAIQLKKAYDTKQFAVDGEVFIPKTHAETCIYAGNSLRRAYGLRFAPNIASWRHWLTRNLLLI